MEEPREEEAAVVKPTPIVLEASVPAAATTDAVAEAAEQALQKAERERLAKRAEKVRDEKVTVVKGGLTSAVQFGVKNVAEPVPGVTVPLVRKFRKPKGLNSFAVGFDVFGDEEQVKKELRMHRFGDVTADKAKTAEAQLKAEEEHRAEQLRKQQKEEEEAWKGGAEKKEGRAARFGIVKRDLEEKPAADGQQEEGVTSKKKRGEKKKRAWRLPRTEPSTSAPGRPDTLYLHGCDNLKSNSVFAVFALYGPKVSDDYFVRV